MKRPIYLDHQATTPLDPRVLEAMMPYLTESFGNAASSEHRYGWVADEAVKQARMSMAEALGASASEIVFTSGATESNNLAIWGTIRAYAAKGNHVITLASEHKAVLDPCEAWRHQGGSVTVLPVGRDGLVDLGRIEAAITDQTILITVMLANNEIGVIQPIAEIGKLAEAAGVLFHSDATQAVGKLAIQVGQEHVHLLSLSAHKFYGPKGVGALYVRRRNPRVQLEPLIYGGGHERGMRSGTLNVPGIVGMATALRLALEECEQEQTRLLHLRTRLLEGLRLRFPQMGLNGHETQRLAGNLNIYFPGLKIATLMREIYAELACSTGAACSSASPFPSHVLAALEENPGDLTDSSLRLGLGRGTTAAEIEQVLHIFSHAVALRPYCS